MKKATIMKMRPQNLKQQNRENGFTLVEIIVGVALLVIIATSFFNVLTSSYQNIFAGGSDVKELLYAEGELELALRDNGYTGKDDLGNVINDNAHEITILSRPMTVRKVSSKIGDDYLVAYALDTSDYQPGQAFIAVGRSGQTVYSYASGDVILTPDMLDGSYIYNGIGALVIPSQDAVMASFSNIDWQIKSDIWISPDVNISSDDAIFLKSIKGNVVLSSVNLQAESGIDIEADEDLDMDEMIANTSSGDINLVGENASIIGSDTRSTIFKIDTGTSNINFDISNEGVITMNQYILFSVNSTEAYAINLNGTTLNTANETDDMGFK